MIQEDRPETWRARLRRWFPERQIHFRTDGRVSFFRISTAFQVSLCLVMVMVAGWGGFSTWSFFNYGKVIAAKKIEVTNAKLAFQSLLGDVAEYQKKFATSIEDLENNHIVMLGLVEKNTSLKQNLKSVSKKLVATRSERETVRQAREALKRQLLNIESELTNTANRAFSLEDNLNTVEDDLQVALSERNRARFESAEMRRKINVLQKQIQTLEENEENTIDRLTSESGTSINSVERIIETAGLDVDALLKASGAETVTVSGQGGPFIPADVEELPGQTLMKKLYQLDTQLNRWNALKQVMKNIPLASPLDTSYITSRFGKRRDPINKRWASHYGLDYGGRYKSKILATAPGVVTYSGRKSKYGWFVEIDHGAGIKTRYAHMNRTLVKKGQKVNFRDTVGLLGKSGRTTGAHLHYELVFNGRPMDPYKFIKAGRNVFQEE